MDDTVLKLLVLRELLSKSGSSDDDSTPSAKNTSLLEVGLKVVRGPDWKWENQDGGEGHIGTVVEIENSDKKVTVVWDNGVQGTYRIGLSNAYDLRTLDNGSIGVNHPTVTCNSCRKKGVIGMRWKCKVCYDYDLCNRCYMSDKHDVTHPFSRFQTYRENKVDVPKRQGSVKILMKGMFASAKVVRGQDWKWERQDGGPGKSGIITDVCGWDDDTDWNACHVTWPDNASSNMYRIGYEGKVDLKCVVDASDGYYYRDHLPVTGDETRAVRENTSANTQVKEVYAGSNESMNRSDVRTNVKEFGTTTETLHQLYETKEFADASFTVKGKRFAVHKIILASRCSEFERLLMDSNSILDNIVEDESVTQTGFEILLRFIYTDNLGTNDKRSIVQAYLAANHYKQTALIRRCEDIMQTWVITVAEVCELLNVSLGIIALERKCLEFIKENASKVISSDDFFKLNYAAMATILEKNALKDVKLRTRIVKIVEWGRKQVKNPDDFVDLREYFLKFNPPLLGKLEMGELEVQEFNEVFNVEYCGLLNSDEITKIMRYRMKKDKTILPDWYKK